MVEDVSAHAGKVYRPGVLESLQPSIGEYGVQLRPSSPLRSRRTRPSDSSLATIRVMPLPDRAAMPASSLIRRRRFGASEVRE